MIVNRAEVFQQKKILDHGFVELIEFYGSDERIIEAARMSTGKGFLGWEPGKCPVCDGSGEVSQVTCRACEGKGEIRGDKHLLRFLYENKHMTPFEMADMMITVQAPIFVFREWHRHRTQSYNEMSARYEPLPDVNYIPTLDRLMINAGTSNKQAGTVKDSMELTVENASAFQDALGVIYGEAESLYQLALRTGVPKELARIHLPVGRYSRMMAKSNLRNWLAFLTLRMDVKAQWEIRQYANAVGDLIAQVYPRTWELFRLGQP